MCVPRLWEPGPEQTASSTSTVWNTKRFPGSTSLGFCVTGPPGHDCYGQYHPWVLYQQAEVDITLVVNLFLWLHFQDIVFQARHIVGCLNIQTLSADQYGMESPS